MRVHFDISHPAHLNFFKYSIKELHRRGHEIFITVLDRGALISIARREFQGYMIFRAGRHRGGIFSIIVEANILKFFRLLAFYIRKKPDVTLSCGGFVAGAIMKMAGRPNYQFDDDPERKNNVRLERLTATLLFFPPVTEARNNIQIYRGIKEWAYLSPRYFQPDITVLNDYNVIAGEYIFVREVSRETLNYMHQNKDPIIASLIESTKGFKVLLSLERKQDRFLYPEDWIMLREPVSDIHSLIYYSRALISSGDSMAREACILGVPSFYCGGRKMAVNEYLLSTGLFSDVKPGLLPSRINEIRSNSNDRTVFRNKLLEEWEDLTMLSVRVALENR